MKFQHLYLLIGICSLSLNGIGQGSCEYENYFYYTTSAFKENGDGNTSKAIELFEKAFNSVDHPLGYDLGVCLNQSVELKDNIRSLKYASTLAKGGVKMDYFLQFEHEPWFKEFQENYDTYRNHFRSHYQTELRQKLIHLRHQDSLYNVDYHNWRKGKISLSYEQLLSGAEAIRDSLVSIIKTHGFPHEKNSGFYSDGESIGQFPLGIVIHHLFQLGDRSLHKSLDKISCNGSLRPVEITSLKGVQGFGDSTGIADEMTIRWERYSR